MRPDEEAIGLFVLSAPPDCWGDRFLLLARVADRYPDANGRRLATIAGGALRLERRNARWTAARREPGRAMRYQEAMDARKRPEDPGVDREAARTAWERLEPSQQAIALARARNAPKAVLQRFAGTRKIDNVLAGIRAMLIDAVDFKIGNLRGAPPHVD